MILFFLLVTLVSSLASKDRPEIAKKSVLVLDLSKHWEEKKREKPLANFSEEGDDPGLFDVVRLIQHAKSDENISGIYLEADGNGNGFASSNEIRNAPADIFICSLSVYNISLGVDHSHPVAAALAQIDRLVVGVERDEVQLIIFAYIKPPFDLLLYLVVVFQLIDQFMLYGILRRLNGSGVSQLV